MEPLYAFFISSPGIFFYMAQEQPKDVRTFVLKHEIYGFFKSKKSTSFENRLKSAILQELSVELSGKDYKVLQGNKVLDPKTGNFIINYDIVVQGKKAMTASAHGKAAIVNRNGKPYIKSQKVYVSLFYF